jgi:hypothetical protein
LLFLDLRLDGAATGDYAVVDVAAFELDTRFHV